MEVKFRKSTKDDISDILEIIKQAQQSFRDQGIDQWQDNYPNSDVIMIDINNNEGYVLEYEESIVATSMVTFEEQPAYSSIYEGEWLSNGKYATIHRIAVSNDYKGLGLAAKLIKSIEDLCLKENVHSIKVDTNKKNIPMQNLLKKSGFKYCGIVSYGVGEMLALEKLL
jgi:GNAT superfamily N-acetyltransferase